MLLANSATEYRNPFGRDGSDQMAEVINGYRIATAVIPDAAQSDEVFLRAVNAQVCVSYLASGLAKLVSYTWRSGEALDLVLQPQQYGQSSLAQMLKRNPKLARILTWLTVVWETAFPLVYIMGPHRARYALSAVRGFHLGVAATMGLPRFFWGFSSSHGAVMYVIDRHARA